MVRPTAMDEHFIHQIPELLPAVATRSAHWRESYFFELHQPDARGDVLFFTLAHYPERKLMDSIQMGCVAGQPLISILHRPVANDPHVTAVSGAHVKVIQPFEELQVWADPQLAAFGVDVTFRARTQPYALRRGSMRAADDVIWDQCHILQSGIYSGTYTVGGVVRRIDGWVGQRDHSWGIRDHARCPMWMWLQLQFDDGFIGVWHWELANGARVYTDGCWAGTDGSAPLPIIDFQHNLVWTDAHGAPAHYGEHGAGVTHLEGDCTFTFAGGRRITVTAQGSFARPYEPYHRGGLSQMRVRADDGREGTAIYEITGARHHRYFPETAVAGVLP